MAQLFILGDQKYAVEPQAVDTSETAVLAATCFLMELDIVNDPSISSGSLNFTAWDADGGLFIPQTQIIQNAMLTYRSQNGRLCVNGFKWQASGAGLRMTNCVAMNAIPRWE